MNLMILNTAFIAALTAIYTKGSIPKWFTILLWFLAGVNLGLFALLKI